MTTNKGDSGSPLIVQPKGMYNLCYIIGMHCSGKYDSGGYKTKEINTAVIVTKKMVKELA